MTLANYLQQRQQTLNKQTSLNSQGSSEPDIQPSPRISRQNNRTDTTTNLNPSSTQRQQQQQQQQLTKSSASATPLGKRNSVERHESSAKSPTNTISSENQRLDG